MNGCTTIRIRNSQDISTGLKIIQQKNNRYKQLHEIKNFDIKRNNIDFVLESVRISIAFFIFQSLRYLASDCSLRNKTKLVKNFGDF